MRSVAGPDPILAGPATFSMPSARNSQRATSSLPPRRPTCATSTSTPSARVRRDHHAQGRGNCLSCSFVTPHPSSSAKGREQKSRSALEGTWAARRECSGVARAAAVAHRQRPPPTNAAGPSDTAHVVASTGSWQACNSRSCSLQDRQLIRQGVDHSIADQHE
jgi:hypothetical protein